MNRFRTGFGIGFTTIIMMLVVVVFTTLGVLALSTAKTDDTLANKNLEFVSDYYEAEGKANEIKARISTMHAQGISAGDIANSIEGVTVHESRAEYGVKVNDRQMIHVQINLEGSQTRVERFNLENTTEWNPSQPISVWEG